MRSRSRFAIGFCTATLLAGGCSSPESRFYVLANPATTAAPRPAPTLAAGDGVIGLGPVQFPGYLDRPQIVTRSGQNELELAEFDRWAEPLKDNAVNVMADALAEALGGQKVVTYPWKRSTPLAFQVVAVIKRFDRTRGAESELAVRWSVLTVDGQKELLSRDARYAEWPADDRYATTVAAMNRTLLKFSRDVATAIREQRDRE